MKSKEKENTEIERPSPKKNRVWKILGGILLLIAIALGVFSSALNRQWGVQFIQNRLSRALHTEVQLDTFHFSLWSGLLLNGLLVEDHHQDTLLYIGHMRIQYHNIERTLFTRTLAFDQAEARDVRIKLTTYPGESKANWMQTFASNRPKFSTPTLQDKGDNENKGISGLIDIDFDIEKIIMESVSLSQTNFDKYHENIYLIPGLEVVIQEDNFKERFFHLKEVILESPSVWFNQYPADDTLAAGQGQQDTTLFFISSPQDSAQDNDLQIVVEAFELRSASLYHSNYRRQTAATLSAGAFIDWNEMELRDIQCTATSVKLTPETITGQLDHLSFREKSGYEITELCIEHITTSRDSILAQSINLYTPKGVIRGDYRMDFDGWESFKYFTDEVYIQAHITEATIPLQDILFFAPPLYDSHYFSAHSSKALHFQGDILGTVNALKGRNLQASIPGDMVFNGHISTRDLPHKGERFFSIAADPLLSNTRTLVDFLQIKPSISRFQRLGQIAFTGKFDGFIQDFVTFGTLESNLGIAKMDMRLNLRPGLKAARYGGHIELQDFDLGTFLDSENFGAVTINGAVTNGRGLTIQSGKANLDAHIVSILYKGYAYQNGVFKGILNKSLIDGDFRIADENIDLNFKGLIRDLDIKPKLDFDAHIKTLKLQPLHLTKEDIRLQGNIRVNLEGTNIDNSSGSIALHHLKIQRDTLHYALDTLVGDQKLYPGGLKTLRMQSDLIDAQFNGNYKLTALHQDVLHLLLKKHPGLYQSLHLPVYPQDTINRFYTFRVHAKNLDPILPVLFSQDIQSTSFDANGIYDGSLDSMEFALTIPHIRWNATELSSVSVNGKIGKSENQWIVSSSKTKQMNIPNHLSQLDIAVNFLRDTMYARVSAKDSSGMIDTLDLMVASYPEDGGLASYFMADTKLSLGGEPWRLDPLNYLYIRKDRIEIQNFLALSDQGKSLTLSNIGSKGVSIEINKVPMSLIDSLLHIPQLNFTGESNIYAQVDNVFKMQGISGGVLSQSLGLNPIQLGHTNLTFKMRDLNSSIFVDLQAKKGLQVFNANGHIRLDSFDQITADKKVGYAFEGEGINLPLKAIKILIPEGISNVKGQVTSRVTLSGIGNKKDLRGSAYVEAGQAEVEYTGVTYFMDKQSVIFKENYIDLTGVVLRDSLGNKGVLTGGMAHNYLADPSMDIQIQSNHILGLSTTKYENPNYYGTAIGEIYTSFSGPFNNMFIDIKGVASEGTHLFIPTGYSSEEGKYRNSFIYFESKDDVRKQEKESSDLQMTVNLDIEIREDAEVSIIFDESAGDILQGSGTGKVHMSILPRGQISMIGEYEVVRGNYLFTLFNVVNKPFIVQPGGKIRWNGDPLNAQLDITTVYENLQAPLAPLIADYLENAPEEIKRIAQRPHEVTLEMHITGALFQPEISFNIKVPNLTGPLRSYSIAKLNDVNQNPATLNQQVFGLIAFNSFFPPSGIGQNNGAINYTASLNEFFSRQLSSLLTGVLQQVVSEIGLVSNVQLNVGYKQVQRYIGTITQPGGGEYNLETSLDLIDAVRLRYKGVYANSSIATESSYLDSEFDVEFIKTGVDGLRFKLIIAQDHFINNTPRSKAGIGVSYKTEFDTLTWRNLIY